MSTPSSSKPGGVTGNAPANGLDQRISESENKKANRVGWLVCLPRKAFLFGGSGEIRTRDQRIKSLLNESSFNHQPARFVLLFLPFRTGKPRFYWELSRLPSWSPVCLLLEHIGQRLTSCGPEVDQKLFRSR